MLQKILCLLVITTAMTLSFCTTTKKATSSDGAAMSTYANDIAPLLEQNCSPCHFPDGGKLTFLDTRNAVKKNIDDVIYRVGLPVGSDDFMPAGSEVALSDSQIQLLKDWRDSGMQ